MHKLPHNYQRIDMCTSIPTKEVGGIKIGRIDAQGIFSKKPQKSGPQFWNNLDPGMSFAADQLVFQNIGFIAFSKGSPINNHMVKILNIFDPPPSNFRGHFYQIRNM